MKRGLPLFFIVFLVITLMSACSSKDQIDVMVPVKNAVSTENNAKIVKLRDEQRQLESYLASTDSYDPKYASSTERIEEIKNEIKKLEELNQKIK